MSISKKRSLKKLPLISKTLPPITESKQKLFPIVAIGASAGGLEAYSRILKNMRADTGMAFVIIQHISPDFKSMLRDILNRETAMEVFTIKNKMKPAANKLYVVPAACYVKIKNGFFYLRRRTKTLKVFKPIDIFMRSLAEDNRHFSIGVILSGGGNDGCTGMGYIKSGGGITYAQDKKSTKFFDMPSCSITSGVVDFILPPEAIARELNRFGTNLSVHIDEFHNASDTSLSDDENLKNIFSLIKTYKNIDFLEYKPSTVKRRVLRRLILHKMRDMNDYAEFLLKNPAEVNALCSDILINVTRFFRDPGMYESLKKNVFPKLFKNREINDPVRIWVSACSTGEEAYSMAIAIVEYLGSDVSNYQIQIFSTDLNETGISKARNGIYPDSVKEDVSQIRLNKFFNKLDSKYQVKRIIRNLCVFAKQNLIEDPPFSKIDIITCRNVFIYLSTVLQNKLLPVFHYALNKNGYLILGTSETIGPWKDLFKVTDRKNRIFLKIQNPEMPENKDKQTDTFDPHSEYNTNTISPEISNSYVKKNEEGVNEKDQPLKIIIDPNFNVISHTGNTQPYLKIPKIKITKSLLNMCRREIVPNLKFLVAEAIKSGEMVIQNNVKFIFKKELKVINIIVKPVDKGTAKGKNYLLIFEESSKYESELGAKQLFRNKAATTISSIKFDRLTKELAQSQVNLQSSVEQGEATDEELKFANEKIQYNNEELQSTNEELETIKEELQSTNEELTIVNDQLQSRNSQLSNVNNDLNNILSGIRFSILMIDEELKIKRYTRDAARLLNLIPSDIGRKITDINPNVRIKNLKAMILEVLEKEESTETNVTDDENTIYSMRIRPYKTLDKSIEGVIITFVDISEIQKSILNQKNLQQETDKLNRTLEKRVEDRTKDLEAINISLQSEIAERRNAESSLRRLSKNLIDAQEIERLKMSRNLHDTVNQLLSIAKLKVYNVENDLKKIPRNRTNVKSLIDAKKYIVSAIDQVRRISKDLRPSALDDIGVNAAVKSLIEDFRVRTGIRVSYKSRKLTKRLKEDIELTLYRIVQESLHNVEKHSKAENVRMSLGQNVSHINLVIADNGRGFENTKSSVFTKKFGLTGIKERVESVGGKLLVKSEKGLGTRIDVKIPLVFKK
ncbi:MAG: CheR family methyltransferase [bacterium]